MCTNWHGAAGVKRGLNASDTSTRRQAGSQAGRQVGEVAFHCTDRFAHF